MFSLLKSKADNKNGNGDNQPLFVAANAGARRRAEAWLQARIESGKRHPIFEVTDITPELAELMLARNIENNRGVKMRRLAAYTRAVKEGRWRLTAQGIGFDRNGVLNDGQHRLRAIIDAGRPATMLVGFGMDEETFAVVDGGTPRGRCDILHIAGESNPALVASMATGLFCIQKGHIRSGMGPLLTFDNDEVCDFVDKHPLLRDAAVIGQRLAGSLRVAPTPVGLAAYFMMGTGATESVEVFFDKMNSGIGLTHSRDPIHVMRERMIKGEYRRRGSTDRFQLTGDLILAWNNFRAGKRTSRIHWKNGDELPTAE